MGFFGDLETAINQPSMTERLEKWMKLMLISQFALSGVMVVSAFITKSGR